MTTKPEVPRISLLFEVDGQLLGTDTISPMLYPLGMHFASEQIRWETAREPKLLTGDFI